MATVLACLKTECLLPAGTTAKFFPFKWVGHSVENSRHRRAKEKVNCTLRSLLVSLRPEKKDREGSVAPVEEDWLQLELTVLGW